MLLNVSIKEIANYLNIEFNDTDLVIDNICAISKIKDRSVSFVNKKTYKFDQSVEALVIAIEGYEIEKNSKCSFIFSKNPRLDFVKVANKFFLNKNESKISDTAKIGAGCTIAENVTIGEYAIIKDNVIIGAGTVINNHVVIESNSIIGKNCYIKSGAVIGEDGFGFERDEDGMPLRFPHIGNVIIGNNVEIGAKTTIARGTLESTIVKDNVKIDDQVFIAHNVFIDENTMIVSCSEISGSTKIGKNCWIGPNCTIKDGLVLGDNIFLGMACVISKNIDSNSKLGTISNLGLREIAKINKLLKDK
jgi:UDP-3-O-[3-hydroxymyristoyl] glucosamine N-acyltransferase